MFVFALLAFAAAAPAARAATFYVDPGGDDSHACAAPDTASACKTINGAIGKARSTTGGDTINIAAATYTENVDLTSSDDTGDVVQGAGTSSNTGTTITYQSSGSLLIMPVAIAGNSPPSNVTLRDVRVVAPTGAPGPGVEIGAPNTHLDDIVVDMQASASTQNAIDMTKGPVTLDRIEVGGAWSGNQVCACPSVGHADVTLRDSLLAGGGSSLAALHSYGGTVTIQRSLLFRPDKVDFAVRTNGSTTIDSSLILGGKTALETYNAGDVRLRNATLDAGTLGTSDSPPTAQAISANNNSSVTVDSSILVDPPTAYGNNSSPFTLSCTSTDVPSTVQAGGNPNYSSINCDSTPGNPGANSHTDPGSLFDTAGNDYHLKITDPVSPAIDSGSTTALASDESAADLDGHPRVLDGNFDCVARRDKGAYEVFDRANTPPQPSISGPDSAVVGTSVSFTGSATDEDPPSALSFSWSFSDGGGGSGPSASHAFGALGAQQATLTVTDSHGCVGRASHPITITAPDAGGGGGNGGTGSTGSNGGNSGNGSIPPDHTPPVVGRVTLTHKVFRVGTRPVARRSRIPRGTAFRYTLSEPATVAISLERVVAGRRVGRVCRKTSPRARRRGPRCQLLVGQGRLRVRGLQGANSTPFSGVLAGRRLAPAPYIARLVATDMAGNRSRERTVRFTVVRG